MKDQAWLVSRRAFLGGVCAAGAASLWPRGGAQAQAQIPERLVIMHVPEGMWGRAPRPSGTSPGPIFEALAPHWDYVRILNGLRMESRDRGPGHEGHLRAIPHMLTGTEQASQNTAGGPSVDQTIADAIGEGTRFPSIQLGVRIIYNDLNASLIWRGPGNRLNPEQDPRRAFSRIFEGVEEEASAPVENRPSFDPRRSVLDHTVRDIARLRGRLGEEDRRRLDTYRASLRELERRVQETMAPGADGRTAGCSVPSLPGDLGDPRADGNYPAVGRLQMDIIAHALQCDLTRVATLQWGNSNDQCTYPWLGIHARGHDLAHNNRNVDPDGQKKLRVYQWYAEQFAYFADRLRAVPQPDGSTLLDHTTVLWVSEFGSSNAHSDDRLLWLLMGNAGGFFGPGGRVFDLEGRSTNDVHATLCQAFGLDTRTFGNPAYCDGPIEGLIA